MKFLFGIFVIFAILCIKLISARDNNCYQRPGIIVVPGGCKDKNDVEGCKQQCQQHCGGYNQKTVRCGGTYSPSTLCSCVGP
uniref:Putative secreted salivary protein n=1 Tax=Xenopsylla cheopis TaxID=163159 RepID=A2IA75_XENCH|nr:putative secreted salivary protein [Xenopsylla cheopis]